MAQWSFEPSGEEPPIRYAVGIDVGSQSCSFCVMTSNKDIIIKPTDFANAAAGFAFLQGKLQGLGVPAGQILVGLEATSRYGENLYQFLNIQGYHLSLLHAGQTHQFAKRRGLRAKTDHLDATIIAHVLLSAEARPGYVPSELIASYRELVRLHTHLSDEAARYQNEIHALLQVLFPEFTQVFADPCRATALTLLERYPSAQAFLEAGVELLARHLHELAPRNYGRQTAEQLAALAQQSVSSGRATAARATSLKILCSQLSHTQQNLAHLEREIETLVAQDPGTQGVQDVQEFGLKTIAVLRAELGDVERFARCDQAIAYAGLDITIKESGKWRGQRKLVLSWQRHPQAHLVSGSHTQRPLGGLCLWPLLSPLGDAWHEGARSPHGRDAQDAGGGLSSLQDPRVLRPQQSGAGWRCLTIWRA